jgi:hypothetical protein
VITHVILVVIWDISVHDWKCVRVGEGTVPLAIVIYIDGSFIKHSIPVKPIYITVRNLDSSVSGKAMAWRVLGMLPGFKKSATPNESDDWRRQRRLEMHHACVKHVVDSINNFCDKDVHVLCADNKVKLGYPCLSLDEHCAEWVITGYPRCVAAEDTLTPCAWTGPRWPLTAAAPREAALHAGAPTISSPALKQGTSIEGLLMCSPSWRARRMSC